MAWIKVQNTKKIPPIPIGTTYTNELYKPAVVGGTQTSNKTEIINTKKTKSLTIQVSLICEAHASGGIWDHDHYTWESECSVSSSFTFKVNDVVYVSRSLSSYSKNGGTNRSTYNDTITITDLPKGECAFDYNISMSSNQNGNQLDPHARTVLSFTITNVT